MIIKKFENAKKKVSPHLKEIILQSSFVFFFAPDLYILQQLYKSIGFNRHMIKY